jgi:hypothetical protein
MEKQLIAEAAPMSPLIVIVTSLPGLEGDIIGVVLVCAICAYFRG